MAGTSLSPKSEVEKLIADQIRAFKETANMDERDLFEYHLRHLQIMTLCRELDRNTPKPAPSGKRVRSILAVQAEVLRNVETARASLKTA